MKKEFSEQEVINAINYIAKEPHIFVPLFLQVIDRAVNDLLGDDKYRMPDEEPIDYIIPQDEQILDNEIFEAYCKVLDDDIWKMRNGLAERNTERSDRQYQALIDYDRFQIVQQLLPKLPLDDTLFEQITTVTIPELLAKEEEAFVPVINTIPQMRIALTKWSERVPAPFPSPSMPAQELLNTKFVEMLNEYLHKANVYLTSQDRIDG